MAVDHRSVKSAVPAATEFLTLKHFSQNGSLLQLRRLRQQLRYSPSHPADYSGVGLTFTQHQIKLKEFLEVRHEVY